MYSIADRQELTKRDMISLTIEAPMIARKIVPGQFVVVRVNETGERVPLTVAYRDSATGTRPGLSLSLTLRKAVPEVGSAFPAAICALA